MDKVMNSELEKKHLWEMADFFKVLSTASRIQILLLLINKECSVTELAEEMQVTQSAVSHQLNVLRIHHMVTFRREGKQILYRLSNQKIQELLLEGAEVCINKCVE